MQSILSGTPVATRQGFWARQFGTHRTKGQDTFDVIFGLVLPIACFLVDPIVFKSASVFGPPLLEDYQLIAYVVSAVEMGTFLVWRTFPKLARTFAPAFAGIFLAGAFFSTVVGLAILPFTLLGLLMIIGLPGLTPFVSAFVYLRNSVRAMKLQAKDSGLALRVVVAALGAMLFVGLPIRASVQVDRAMSVSVNTLVSGSAVEAEEAAHQLKRFRFVSTKHRNQMAEAYARESDPVKKDIIKRVYQDIVGDDLELRWPMLVD
jgi:hypothetical protein